MSSSPSPSEPVLPVAGGAGVEPTSLTTKVHVYLASLAIGLSAIPLGAMAMVLGAVRGPTRIIDWCYRGFGHVVSFTTGTPVKPIVWKVPPDQLPKQVVVVSNHESLLDISAILLGLGERSVRFVAKRVLFKIPFFGWGLRFSGSVPVARNRTGSDLSRLREAGKQARGSDVIFFAEGTRSRDGSLRPFKKGAVIFALEHGLPLLPVGIGGSFERLPPGGVNLKPGPVGFVVGAPIEVTGLSVEDREALLARCEREVALLREEAQRLVDSPRSGPKGRQG